MKGRFLVLLLVFTGACAVESVGWETLGVHQGLASSSVTAVTQDDDGFLWFATQNGLNRWDGYHMNVWQNDPFVENTLANNLVQTMTADGGVLWLGTYGGLDRFDRQTGAFRHFRHSDADPTSLPDDVVLSILRDSRQRLWVATLGGLALLDEKEGTFRRFPSVSSVPTTLSAATVRSLAEDRRGRLWVGTAGGLDRLSDDGKSVERFGQLFPGHSIPLGAVMGLLADTDSDTLWLGVWGQGLVRLDLQTGESSLVSLSDNRVFHLSRGLGDEILVATWGGGLVSFEPATAAQTVFRHQASEPESLAHDVVYGAFFDRGGLLWVPTNGGGVSFRNPQRPILPTFATDSKVTVLFQDSAKRLWVGLYNRGVVPFDPQKGLGTPVSTDIVNAVAEDRQGLQWWATNNGLVRFDPRSRSLKRYSTADGLPEEILTSLRLDADGSFWIGTFRNGLLHRPAFGADGPVETLVPGSLVNYSLVDRSGHLWVGTNDGVVRVKAGVARSWVHDSTNRASLAGNSVRVQLQDSSGRLWFGTNGGLSLFDDKTETFTTFGRAEGLENLTIVGIQQDNAGDLWVSTVDGLYRLRLADRQFSRFDASEGPLGSEFYRGAESLPGGTLAFGGVGFLTVFSPALLGPPLPSTPVTVTGITIVNHERPVTETVNLAWNENDLSFSFSLMEFSRPNHHRYQYRLEGHDKTWIDAGNRHEAIYSDLPAGKYLFRVKANSGGTDWIETAKPVRLRVEVAPWNTWYAWLGYVAILLSALVLSGKIYSDRRWKHKAFELENLKSQLLDVNRQLDQLSRLDGLTNIPNRRALDAWLDNEWALAQRQKQTVALIMLDIDYFKRYNDNKGHLAGDACLRSVAKILADSLHRTTDFCARYGGEEFVVILHDTELDGGVIVAQRLLDAVDELRVPHETSVESWVTVSLGVAAMRPSSDSLPQDLLQAADKALYEAKAQGRHRVCLAWSPPSPSS
ncbi:MAG: diguanylate cyclase [Spirochaetales bacterium]